MFSSLLENQCKERVWLASYRLHWRAFQEEGRHRFSGELKCVSLEKFCHSRWIYFIVVDCSDVIFSLVDFCGWMTV